MLRLDPYGVLEGLLIACHAVGAESAFIGIKASFERERQRLADALAEVTAEGWVDRVVTVVAGPEEYLFGEEKAMLEVIEGNEPLPRWLPPYLHGLFSTAANLGWEAHPTRPPIPFEDGADPDEGANPTLVNNVETLANVAHILRHGPEWFRSLGTEESCGTICCTVVGDVGAPGVVEVELGTPLADVLASCGGPLTGPLPCGPCCRACRTRSCRRSTCRSATRASRRSDPGSVRPGSSSTTTPPAWSRWPPALSRFLAVESCGQCPPCKLGTGAITAALDRIAGGSGTTVDLDTIVERLRIVADGNRCYLPVEEQRVVASLLNAFPEDFEYHLIEGRCPRPRTLPIPKIVDIADGVVTYDERQAHKRADWTYET